MIQQSTIPALLFLFFLFTLPTACNKDNTGPIFLSTKVCFKTQHHERAVSPIDVYIQYGATGFPGYENLSVFDTMIVTDEFGDVCFPSVPLGKHYVVGIGYDDLLQEPVRGSLPFEITNLRVPWDTILYISEY